MAKLIDGKALALKIREGIKEEVSKITSAGKRPPGLSVILVGEDPASEVYVRMKGKACVAAGIKGEQINLPADVSEEVLLNKIQELNQDETVDGILLQLPLPKHLNDSR